MRDTRGLVVALGVLACALPGPAGAFVQPLVAWWSGAATLRPALRSTALGPSVAATGAFCARSRLCSTLSPDGLILSVGGRKALRLRPLRMQAAGDEGGLVDGEKYTEKAFAVMQKLAGIADRFKQQYIEADLLLYASLQDETVQKIVSKAAGKGAFSSMLQQLVRDVEKFINTQPQVSGGQGQKLMGRCVRVSCGADFRHRENFRAPQQ